MVAGVGSANDGRRGAVRGGGEGGVQTVGAGVGDAGHAADGDKVAGRHWLGDVEPVKVQADLTDVLAARADLRGARGEPNESWPFLREP